MPFCIPEPLWHHRDGSGELLYCPNGHGHAYETAPTREAKRLADVERENAELKREILRIAHEAEQDAARLRDELGVRPGGEAPAQIEQPEPRRKGRKSGSTGVAPGG